MTTMTRTAYGLSSAAIEGPDWRREGPCRTDPDRWSDIPAGLHGNEQAAEVAHQCIAHCPSLKPCREEAVALGLAIGRGVVQGGMRVQGRGNQERLLPVKPTGHGDHCPSGTWRAANQLPILQGAKHGHPGTYRRGCRCQPCMTAWAKYRRARKAVA